MGTIYKVGAADGSENGLGVRLDISSMTATGDGANEIGVGATVSIGIYIIGNDTAAATTVPTTPIATMACDVDDTTDVDATKPAAPVTTPAALAAPAAADTPAVTDETAFWPAATAIWANNGLLCSNRQEKQWYVYRATE
jgi:hypothetical protein